MRQFYLLVVLLFCIPLLSVQAQKRPRTNAEIEQEINRLLKRMTLKEKVGQTAQRGTSSRVKGELSEELKDAVRKGRIGSMLNVTDRDLVDQIQKIAVQESPNKIPIIFARDVIHGYKTIFPIPLGQAATWDTAIVEQGARISAEEASTNGIRWTFAPMLDVSRDARWGRIAESPGEDPYLASQLAKAYVKGFQGTDLSDPTSIAACAKHFVAYGAAEGGRDYNSTYVPEYLLREVYFPPFKAAVDAGAATFMSSFNDVNGVPATGNKFILKDVLRDKWKFDGFVVSDWNSVTEMIAHGYAADSKEAARKAALAGLDMEMTSTAYEDHLKTLIDNGTITMTQLDDMVRHILRIKFRLGLFENPYVDRTRDKTVLSQSHLAAAKEAAIKSMVLLKNEGDILPLSKDISTVAVIGPLADAPHEQLGTWIFDGSKKDSRTPVMALRELLGDNKIKFIPALKFSRDKSTTEFSKALAVAETSDVVLFFGGEEAILSGEAHSRAHLNLPGAQEDLIRELKKSGKKIVLVIFAGRPITLENIVDDVDAVLMGWHPGTMGGPAVTDVLFGEAAPGGRLPVTWPKTAGQIPIYYNHSNTGRPASEQSFVHIDDIPVEAWQSSLGNTSHYLDAGFTPQYPFGYGLSYTTFEYSNLALSESSVSASGTLTVSAVITNTGKRTARETVQLYIRDLVADRVRPVRELKGFKQVVLDPGQKETVKFELQMKDLGYYNQEMKYVVEPGKFKVWIARNAAEGLEGEFEIK